MHLSTDHSQSSHGVPVLVDPETRQARGPADPMPDGQTAAQWAREHLPDDPLLSRFLAALPPDQR